MSSDNVREQIEKVQRDLKKMSRGGNDSDEDETVRKAKKPKRTGPSLLQLEREKYASGKKSKSKDDSDTLDVLDSFRSRLFQAQADASEPSGEPSSYPSAAEAALGIEQDASDDDVS